MTKLLSDEELLAEIDVLTNNILFSYGIEAKDSYDTRIFDLINTQKRLYAESIIETSKEIILTHSCADFEAGYIKGREDLRAEQRARIK